MDMQAKKTSRATFSLLLILLAALALRMALVSLPRLIRWDEPDYLWLGASLLRGNGYTITGVPELHYTPLLPVLAGAVSLLTGSPEWGSNIWFVLLGALLTLPVYWIARRIYGERIALISTVLVAFFPGLSSNVLYWGTMTEPLYVLLIYAAAWVLMQALAHEGWRRYALAGALVGLAYLARPEGLIWFSGYAALLVLVRLFRRRLLRWASLGYLATFIAGALLVASPYLIFMHQQTGRWMPTGKLSITYDIGEAVLADDPALYDKVTASLDAESGEILWWSHRRFERSMLDVLLDDPVAFVQRTWRNAQIASETVLAWTVLPFFLAIFVFLGWFRRPWSAQRLTDEVVLAFTLLPVLSFMPFHIEARFFAPAFPAVLIWVAAGLSAMGDWAAETVQSCQGERQRLSNGVVRSIFLLLLTGGLLLIMGMAHLRVVRAGMQSLNYGHKEAGLWLRDNTPADVSVMSRDLAISLYAQRGFVVSPRAPYREYLDYARRKGADYLVVDERELRDLRPHLAFLLDDEDPPPELEAVYKSMDGHGRTIVYRIKD